jgi:integrase
LIYFGNVKLQNISPQKAEIFILEHFQKAKYGASLYHRVLKAAFRKALTWKYIDSNPFSQIKLPKIQHKSPIFLTVDELKIILDNTDKKVLRDIFMFAFLTGLRLAEVVNLT